MRKSIVALAGALLMLVGGAQAGLINYYSFNSQNMVDEANIYNQNTGTTVTTASWAYSGAASTPTYVVGTGRSYNGAPGNYALYITSGNGFSSAMVLPSSDADVALGSAFTVELWVNPNGGYTSSTSVTFMSATNFQITKSGYGDPGTETAKIGAATAAVGSWPQTGWHHIALVSDGTNGTFYRDGVATSLGAVGSMGVNTAIKIGLETMNTTYPNGWDVYVDDVAMWNVALSASTIADHAQLSAGAGYGLTVPEPATLAVLGIGGLGVWFRSRRKR